MATQSFQLDPNAQSYTDDEIVGKVNTATANITRASSVDAAARPIGAGEVGNDEIEAAAGIEKSKLASLEIADTDVASGAAIAKSKLAALNIVDADVDAGAAIGGSKLASTAAKDNLDALADTARGYVKTDPQSGEFKVIAVQRDATGKLDVDYDDVAV